MELLLGGENEIVEAWAAILSKPLSVPGFNFFYLPRKSEF